LALTKQQLQKFVNYSFFGTFDTDIELEDTSYSWEWEVTCSRGRVDSGIISEK